MSGGLKVNLSYNDNNTISDNGINVNEGFNFSVGDLGPVEESAISISAGGIWPLVWNTGSYNYNESGVFVFVKNEGTGIAEVQISLTATERSGASFEWITMGQLQPPPAEGVVSNSGEFIWIYLGSADEVQASGGGSGVPRGLRIKAINENVNIQYGVYTR